METENQLEVDYKNNTSNHKEGYLVTFKKFFNNILNTTSPEEKEKQEKEAQLQKEVENYFKLCLSNKSYLLCVELISQGYTPTKTQQQQFEYGVYVENEKNHFFIEEYYQKNNNIDDQLFAHWIHHHYKKLFNNKNKTMSSLLNNESFSIKMFKLFNQNHFDYLTTFIDNIKIDNKLLGIIYENDGETNNININKFNNIITFSKDIVERYHANENLTKEDLILYKTNLQWSVKRINSYCDKINTYNEEYDIKNRYILKVELLEHMIQFAEKHIEKKLNHHHQDILKKLNNINTIDKIENQINHHMKIRVIDIKKELPQEAKKLLEEINIKYKKVKDSYENKIDTSIIEIDTLYEKNTVEIIKKYLSTDEQFRDEFVDKNNNTVKDIMIDALEEVDRVLDKKLLEINITKMKDISVYYNVMKSKNLSNK